MCTARFGGRRKGVSAQGGSLSRGWEVVSIWAVSVQRGFCPPDRDITRNCRHFGCPIIINNAIFFIDTSNNSWHNQAHWLTGTPYLSTISSNAPFPLWTEWQTRVKTLLCPKFRLRAVMILWFRKNLAAKKMPHWFHPIFAIGKLDSRLLTYSVTSGIGNCKAWYTITSSWIFLLFIVKVEESIFLPWVSIFY